MRSSKRVFIRLPLALTLLAAVLLAGCITLLALWCQPNSLRGVLIGFKQQPLLIVLNALPVGLLLLAFTALLRNVFFGAAVVNVLVCGIDYEEGRAYTGDGSNDGMTDMIMYVNFDVANHKINMLQIPRDTYPGEEYKHGNTGKINAVALHNDGIGSLMELIYEQYKLPVDYYVTIDMQSLKEIVDLFGGIEVYIPKDISYKGSTLEQGYRNLNGEAAEFFVRNRNYAQADIARLDMQRYFYQGLFARIRTATVWDLAKLAPVALKYVETNIPMKKLIGMGVSFLKVDSANIMMCKLPTYSAAERYNNLSILICDVAKTTDLLNQYFRTYGGPVYELDVPTRATVGESTDPNVQYMGQLDTEAETAQTGG